jgi:hypothetical protein
MSAIADEDLAPRIEALIAQLEPLQDTRLAPAKELVGIVLELHARGLTALMRIVAMQGDVGQKIQHACIADRDVNSLLILHGMHPEPLESRIRRGLAVVTRDWGSRGLAVHLVSVDAQQRVRVRLEIHASHGFSVPRLRQDVESAVLRLAPEVSAFEFDGVPATGEVAFVPVEILKPRGCAKEANDAQ